MSPGGRPRDPALASLVLAAASRLLADAGLGAFTADAVASEARVGKASIYRRWNSIDELLADVVLHLVPGPVEYSINPGRLRSDLIDLLTTHAVGVHAKALAAVLPQIGRDTRLGASYVTGPLTALVTAARGTEVRSRHRAEPEWLTLMPVRTAWAALLHATALGKTIDREDVADVVDVVVVPTVRSWATPRAASA